MSTNKTTNYQLNQWEAADKVLRTEFNADNQKIDAALAGLVSQLAGKADKTELAAFPKLIAGSYVGTGASGDKSPTRLNFPQRPAAIFVGGAGWRFWALNGMSMAESNYYKNTPGTLTLTWSDTGVSWYGDDAIWQMNGKSTTYYYVALFTQ